MTVPSPSRARLNSLPADTARTSRRPLTGTGTSLGAALPSPSCPVSLPPHATTVPSLSRARLWSRPADTALTPLRPLTGTGTSLCAVLPSPSCPSKLAPQAMTDPGA